MREVSKWASASVCKTIALLEEQEEEAQYWQYS